MNSIDNTQKETAYTDADTKVQKEDAIETKYCNKGDIFNPPIEENQAFKIVYSIDGNAIYRGETFCKAVGKVEGLETPLEGYAWEYYFTYDENKKTYSKVCYKFSFPLEPAKENCPIVEQ